MKRIMYAKLVRDLIPDVLVRKRKTFSHRVLGAQEISTELRKKLAEEAGELAQANSREHIIKELADVVDIVEAFKIAENISTVDVEMAQHAKQEKAGGFKKGVFLEWTEDDGYEDRKRQL